MGSIVLLALAAAVYPQLLAVVVVILTRARPQPLLWACYLAALGVSVGASIVILAVFRGRGTIAGTSSNRVGPAAYLIIGAVAVVLAIVMIRRRSAKAAASPTVPPGAPGHVAGRGRLEQALDEGSLVVAAIVGALLAIPGPFDLLALGRLARGGYAALAAALAMVGFALVKFALIEVPIAAYMVDPAATSDRVSAFSAWMKDNKAAVAAGVVGLIGLVLVGRGVTGLI